MGKNPVVIQGFVRIMDNPLQHFLLIRDIIEIAQKKPSLLQVVQTRTPDEDIAPFRERLVGRLAEYYGQEYQVADVMRGGVSMWCIRTGPGLENDFEGLVESVRSLDSPEELEDPGVFSA